MKILVTGGAGFIGFHVAKALLERGDSVTIIDNFNNYYDPRLKYARIKQIKKNKNLKVYKADITNYKKLEKIYKKHKFEKICHLAAQAGVRYSLKDPVRYEMWNNLGTLNLLELARKHNIKDFIYASSSSVYGGNKKIPFSEKDNVDNPISLYAATKKTNELYAHVYHRLYNINCTGLRFFTCFSKDTNVLTPEGLRNIKDFHIGDDIYTLNPKTKEMEISKVIATQHKRHSGKMVLFDLQSVTWEVTPDHNMFVKTERGFWHFYNAEKFLKIRSRYGLAHSSPLKLADFSRRDISLWNFCDDNHEIVIKTSANKTQKNLNELGLKFNWGAHYYELKKHSIEDPEEFEKKYKCSIFIKDHHYVSPPKPYKFDITAFVQFLGWYISEGNLRKIKYSQITISQHDPENKKEIISIIKKLNMRPIIGKKEISFMSRLIENYLRYHGLDSSKDKRIPIEFLSMNYTLRKLLWSTLMKGDGDKDLRRYTTISKRLAEDMYHLSISCGIRTRIIKEGKFYRIRFSHVRKNPCIKPHQIKSKNVEEEDVYCVTTSKNNIIFAGKGYNLGWIGQCYGPFGRPDMALFQFVKNILEDKPIEVYNHGKMKRDFTYVSDIVHGTISAIDRSCSCEIFNLGNNKPIDLMRFIGIIEKALGKKAKKQMLPLQPGDVPETFADIEKARKMLKYNPKINIEEGIKKFIKWYKRYYNVR